MLFGSLLEIPGIHRLRATCHSYGESNYPPVTTTFFQGPMSAVGSKLSAELNQVNEELEKVEADLKALRKKRSDLLSRRENVRG